MKLLNAILIIAVIFLTFLLISKGCDETELPDYADELNELKAERDSLAVFSSDLRLKIDSLSAVKSKIRTQIVYRDSQIDSSIAKDSMNAIPEYRRSLQDNNWLPDGTPQLTLREVGIGAKLMAQVPKLELTIKYDIEQLATLDSIITKKDETILSWQETDKFNTNLISAQAEVIKEQNSFFRSPELWFGVGLVVGVGVMIGAGLAQ